MGDFASKAAKLKQQGSFEAKAAALKTRPEPPPQSQDEWDASIKAEADKLAAEDAALPQVGVTPEGLDAERAATAIQDQAVQDAAPKPQASWGDRFLETAGDGLRGLNSGLYLNGSDEVAAAGRAATGGNYQRALQEERAANAAAQDRSPWTFTAAKTLGYVPGMFVGGATALSRGAAAIGQGFLGGAGGSDSDDLGRTFVDGLKGANTSGAVALGLQGAGQVAQSVGNKAVNGAPMVPGRPTTAPQQMQFGQEGEMFPLNRAPMTKAAPDPTLSAPGLRSMANEARTPEFWDKPLVSKTVDRLSEGLGAAAGFGHGHDMTSSLIGAGVGRMATPAVEAAAKRVAPPLLNAGASVVSGLGATAQGIGTNLQSPASSLTAATLGGGQSRGNLLPDAALSALQNDPQQLGSYKGEFAKAAVSPEPGAVGALIARLVNTDERFRTEVLPALQRATLE